VIYLLFRLETYSIHLSNTEDVSRTLKGNKTGKKYRVWRKKIQ